MVVWIFLYLLAFSGTDALEVEKVSPKEQAETVKLLLKRLIPARADEFLIGVDPTLGLHGKDSFRLQTIFNKTEIIGSSGYAAAYGVHSYLKNYCNCHVSWSGDQLKLPDPLPRITDPGTVVSNDKFRYYQNVCTSSYSFVWWNWTRWEREIDLMALNGINLALAFTGQEWIWKKVFSDFNFTNDEIDEFFTGPAFLAWNRMGNVQLWGGPLPDSWHNKQTILQHQILNRMRAFGMTPVLPAFSGRVPPAILRKYPNASVSVLSKTWGHFKEPYGGVTFLEPTDPLFKKIGMHFLKQYTQEFGSNHVYSADLFNEMEPPSREVKYLSEAAKATFETMTTVDSESVWLLQGWMFFHDPATWQPAQVEGFVTSIPKGKMVILDLQAELFPQYSKFKSYYGQPFIWCMLHNYGGVSGLYGSLNQVNNGPFEARKFPNSTMIGTGITPEGIETNDVVYEFMHEMGWRKSPVFLDKWLIDYSKRRYGASSYKTGLAWVYLGDSVYNASSAFRNHGKYILTTRPSLEMSSYIWYNKMNVYGAWEMFIYAGFEGNLEKFAKSQLFKHDIVDICRQGLQLIMMKFYNQMLKSYRQKNIDDLKERSALILGLYDDLENLLASDGHFLLGRWLDAAKSWSVTPEEMKQYEYNARNQITLWGPNGEILDYANKQWSGVVSGYYKKRWELFLGTLIDCLNQGLKFNESRFEEEVLHTVEIPFTLGNEYHPVMPKGDPFEISKNLFRKYGYELNELLEYEEESLT